MIDPYFGIYPAFLVTFSYSKEPEALKAVQNISFKVEPGQHIAYATLL